VAILKVARIGHPAVRARAVDVAPARIAAPDTQRLIDDMIETMHEYAGIGLAAPQVHQRLRIFVAHLDAEGRGDDKPMAIINPEIEVVGAETVEGWEGCLSIPDIRGMVPRAAQITVAALDRQGKRIEIRAKDFPARVIQHETDHLNGVLFFDRMHSLDSLTYMEEFSRYHARKSQDEDDEA
jgi:peptide deformylase